jgi:hypothetical protein
MQDVHVPNQPRHRWRDQRRHLHSSSYSLSLIAGGDAAFYVTQEREAL